MQEWHLNARPNSLQASKWEVSHLWPCLINISKYTWMQVVKNLTSCLSMEASVASTCVCEQTTCSKSLRPESLMQLLHKPIKLLKIIAMSSDNSAITLYDRKHCWC